MPVPSVARDTFEKITGGDAVAYLRAMIGSDPPTMESEHIDFKGGTDRGVPLNEKKIFDIWSEAVAGFATTGGGVLVLGLDARKEGDPAVDQVVGENLFADTTRVKSRLMEVLHQATDPPVRGVVVEAFPTPEDPTKGFLVCLIPESDFKPHRAEMHGKRWMMRIGGSFVDVPPAVLRSLFFPRRQSYIWMEITPHLESAEGVREGHNRISFRISLMNEGPATATQVNLVTLSRLGRQHGESLGDFWIRGGINGIDRWRYQEPFHVGDKIVMGSVTLDVPYPLIGAAAASPTFSFRLMALDQSPQRLTINFSERDLETCATKRAEPIPIDLERFM